MFAPTSIDSAIDKRWGMFWWIWRPYMWAVPHRSRLLSHGLLIPPLLRLLYFLTVVTLLFLSLTWALGHIGIVVPDMMCKRSIIYLALPARHHAKCDGFLGFITGGAAIRLPTGWYRRQAFPPPAGLPSTRDYSVTIKGDVITISGPLLKDNGYDILRA